MANETIIALLIFLAVYVALLFWPRPDATQITDFDNGTPDQMIKIKTDEGVEILETFYLFAGHELTFIAVNDGQATRWEIKQDGR